MEDSDVGTQGPEHGTKGLSATLPKITVDNSPYHQFAPSVRLATLVTSDKGIYQQLSLLSQARGWPRSEAAGNSVENHSPVPHINQTRKLVMADRGVAEGVQRRAAAQQSGVLVAHKPGTAAAMLP